MPLPDKLALTEMDVTVLKCFVLVTVLLFGPASDSVCAMSLASVPVSVTVIAL